MTFRPRMQAETHSYRTLRPLRVRSWPGVVADVWHVGGDAGGGGFYLSPDPRLVVFLGNAPKSLKMKTSALGDAMAGVSTLYVPAGQPLWSELGEEEEFAHLDFHLQAGPLMQRLATVVGSSTLSQTCMLDSAAAGSTIPALAAMVAAEIEKPTRPAMMLDGLLTALLTDVFDLPNEPTERGAGLSPRQVATVKKHVREAFPAKVSVAELAELCGVSESWFTRAFRRSLGDTPQRWMTGLRLQAARDMMVASTMGLAEIATMAGFSDQAHFTRVFQSAHGEPPSQWRRVQRMHDES